MTGRTCYWGLVMFACLWSIISFSDAASEGCLGWGIPLLIAVGGVSAFGVRWLVKYLLYRNHNFKIRIVHNLSSQDMSIDYPCVRPIPRGASELFLVVFTAYKFKVGRVDFRALDQDYRPVLRFTRGFPANVEITQLDDIFDGGLARSQSNGIGGMEGEYGKVIAMARGQGLYFRLRIEAHIPDFRGYISFRAQSDDGDRSYARYAFWVDPNLPESNLSLFYKLPTLENPPPGWGPSLWKQSTP